MKTLAHCFPPKLSQRLARGVLTGPMNSVVITTVLIPGFVSVLLFLVFTYLHEQSRQPYFRAWQLAWAAYSLHYVLDTFPRSSVAFLISELFLVAMALCIFISTRLMRSSYHLRWYDVGVAIAGVALSLLTLQGHLVDGVFRPDVQPAIRLGLGLAAILLQLRRLLREQPQARIAGVPGAGHLAGAVGCLDGGGAIAKPPGRNVWQRQPPVWPGAPDAVGHCHGDGA